MIKVEDQKRRTAHAKPYPSLNTSDKCRLYVKTCILLCFPDMDTNDFLTNPVLTSVQASETFLDSVYFWGFFSACIR